MKYTSILTTLLLLILISVKSADAIVDPMAFPNNKIGIHILDPNEVEEVADLVNGNGGQWGYVTVPIRDNDRDRIKWQRFMDKCKHLKLIPIVRLATVMKPGGWESPTLLQSLDFANFLNGLRWPTRNRYIIVYNEPNHASEWDGYVDPAGYAVILKYTSQIFKVRNEDFFILPAGLDAAAPNGNGHLSIYNFINQMVASEADVFEHIDGYNSHSYPNPGFAGTPADVHSKSITSYRHEIAYLKNFTNKDFPIFITETGWKDDKVGEDKAASYYKIAFDQVWNENQLIAVTPFLFRAGAGPFTSFSLFRANGEQKPAYMVIKNLSKTKGEPELYKESLFANVLGETSKTNNQPSSNGYINKGFSLAKDKWKKILSWFLVY